MVVCVISKEAMKGLEKPLKRAKLDIHEREQHVRRICKNVSDPGAKLAKSAFMQCVVQVAENATYDFIRVKKSNHPLLLSSSQCFLVNA